MAMGVLALSGCASYKPVPEGYAGGTATIKDTFKVVARTEYVAPILVMTEDVYLALPSLDSLKSEVLT